MTRCRNATQADLETILDWAAEEGWNPGFDDAEAFFQADPNGFFVAVDQSDTPLASISVVNHSDAFSFLGLYIVRPEFRGQGIGFDLWRHALAHAGTRTVGLDGVEAQQQNYASSGFSYAGATTRYSGAIQALADPEISPAETTDDLVALEGAASGATKPRYLKTWFALSEHRKTIVLRDGDRIRGFCTIRRCRHGAKIGPLLTEDGASARRLIKHAATMFDGPLTLDVPQAATQLTELCQSLGLAAGFKTARMYRGPFQAPEHELFAVSSLELG